MTQITQNMNASKKISQLSMADTAAQIKALNQMSDTVDNPQLAKYLKAVRDAVGHVGDLEKDVFNKCEALAKPVESVVKNKGFLSKCKGFIKALF